MLFDKQGVLFKGERDSINKKTRPISVDGFFIYQPETFTFLTL